jgi:hypothetical protein
VEDYGCEKDNYALPDLNYNKRPPTPIYNRNDNKACRAKIDELYSQATEDYDNIQSFMAGLDEES